MLTRLRFKKDIRFVARCFSDKHTDDGKLPKIEKKEKKADKTSENATERIQELLKSMVAAPKISETEYRKKFATAPLKRPRHQEDIEVKTEKIEESITKAAGDVAQAIGGDIKQTEAELLSRVLGKINQTSTSLSDLLVGMKVDRNRDAGDADTVLSTESRGQKVKRLMEKPRPTTGTRFSQRKTERKSDAALTSVRKQTVEPLTMNVFGGEPLGIFKPREPNYGTQLDMWQKLKQRELSLATAQPPANYFEKMIQWTEQGKVWKFPINNEQGLEEEQNVHFSEHIFLEVHLEGWCPKKGPIRHFMELVCVGLSKNAFYTVQEKKDHILWYKEYFESKKDLLSEVGAWDPKPSAEASV